MNSHNGWRYIARNKNTVYCIYHNGAIGSPCTFCWFLCVNFLIVIIHDALLHACHRRCLCTSHIQYTSRNYFMIHNLIIFIFEVMSSPDISTITEEYAQSNHSDDFDGPTEALTTSCSREAGTTKSLDKHEEDSLTSSYTDDFETVTKTSRPTPRSRSFNTSLGRSYCDDFESTTRTPRDVGAGTPTMADVHTARSIPSMVQSEDWESYSRTPRKAVRARSMELLTARSAASLAYSDDFETATFTGRTPPHSARY